jgi:hypothetical protein
VSSASDSDLWSSLTLDGVAEGLHWDEQGGHGDGLAGESLSTVMTYVATGSVQC